MGPKRPMVINRFGAERPARRGRYRRMKDFMPVADTVSPKPGITLSQITRRLPFAAADSTTRLVSFFLSCALIILRLLQPALMTTR